MKLIEKYCSNYLCNQMVSFYICETDWLLKF